ncbi:MAG: iron-containing alcohol dehydrogenase [Armatimonadota bacterium]
MLDAVYNNPTKLIFGRGASAKIVDEITAKGHKNVLLLAGGGSIKSNGVYSDVTKALTKAGVQWVEVWGVKPNPVLSKVLEAIEAVKQSNCDAVLAIGGGSTADSAKAVAQGVFQEDPWAPYEGTAEITKALPVYIVLTISATGSEMNANSVLTEEVEQKKYHIINDLVRPVASAIDPAVQATLPWRQTGYGAVDALSHIMEGYFSGKGDEVSLAVSEALMREIIKSTDKLQLAETNYEARANLAWAATLALNGISSFGLEGDWATHGIEHGISAMHPQIAHGAGLAVAFPAWITYTADASPALYDRWAREVWGQNGVEMGVKAMKNKYQLWGMPVSLSQLGLCVADIKPIVENINRHDATLGTVKILRKPEYEAILKLALE